MSALDDLLRGAANEVHDEMAQLGIPAPLLHERGGKRNRRTSVSAVLAAAAVVVVVSSLVALASHERDREPVTQRPPAGSTAPSTTGTATTVAPTEPHPNFQAAPGWETVTTPETASATAANVPLGPGTRSGHVPWDTVERLEDGDVVLFAMIYPTGERAAIDANFPRRELPLSLDDAQHGGLEGQPDHIYADRLAAQVNGWNIDLLIFYGGGDPTAVPPVPAQPSAETRAAAQEQLTRLVVPARRTDRRLGGADG